MRNIKHLMLCIAILFVCVALFTACNEKDPVVTASGTSTTTTIDNNDPYTFDNIANLISAVKKDLDKYKNMQVSVKGSILNIDEQITLSDARGDGGVKHRYDAKDCANITISMSNDEKAAILDSGDYVKIFGTVKISDTGIYLDNCDYEMIESIYD